MSSLGNPLRSDTFSKRVEAEVASALGHVFKNTSLLEEALTHSSFKNEKNTQKDNERLEFLGDAVIGLVIGEQLWLQFPKAAEGQLSRWRGQLVSRKSLADFALQLGMGHWVLLGKGEERSGGATKRSILAGVFESVVGALYLEGGISKARKFLLKVYRPLLETLTEDDIQYRKELDQKTFLQEITQSRHGSTPLYRVVDAWGLEHEKSFKVEIEIAGAVIATGQGKSKKEAEQKAAQQALEVMGL